MAAAATPHQLTTLGVIYRRTLHHEWIDSGNVGCRGACQHLERKGLIVAEEVRGSRGGTTYRYKLTEAGQAVMARRNARATAP